MKTRILNMAARRLAKEDDVLGRALEQVGGVRPWRSRPAGFTGLACAVCFQQVSSRAALAIWTRLDQTLGGVTEQKIAATSADELRACGLSRAKIACLKRLTEACAEGAFDFERIAAADDAQAQAELVSIKGIGNWTANVYLMFSLGRPDIFPDRDMALLESYRVLSASDARASPAAMAERAMVWRPWRSVAAHLLWAWYRRNDATDKTAW